MSLRSLSLQLYSVRNALDEDMPQTIARVADIGYKQVEASYKFLSRGPALLDAIRANDLTSPTMTGSLVDVDNRDHVFATAVELGARSVIDTFIPEPRWSSAEDVRHIAHELNAAAAEAAEHGLRVGYHNHWWELQKEFDGVIALELLISHLAPEVVLEVDAYWVAVGGVDPVDFVARHSDRVRFLHLKDGPINNDNAQQVAAGQGKLPIVGLLEAATLLEAGIVEFDEFDGDVFGAIGASFDYLNRLVVPE